MKVLVLAFIALVFVALSGCVSSTQNESNTIPQTEKIQPTPEEIQPVPKEINARAYARNASKTRFMIYNDNFFDYTGVQIILQEKFVCDTNSIIPARQNLTIRADECKFQEFTPGIDEVTSLELNTNEGVVSFLFE